MASNHGDGEGDLSHREPCLIAIRERRPLVAMGVKWGGLDFSRLRNRFAKDAQAMNITWDYWLDQIAPKDCNSDDVIRTVNCPHNRCAEQGEPCKNREIPHHQRFELYRFTLFQRWRTRQIESAKETEQTLMARRISQDNLRKRRERLRPHTA